MQKICCRCRHTNIKCCPVLKIVQIITLSVLLCMNFQSLINTLDIFLDQPDGIENNENCVSMDTFGMGAWEDKQCDEKLGFVCRMSGTLYTI